MRYILVDGVDGTGKSTLCEALASQISNSKVLSFPTEVPESDFDHLSSEILYYLNDFNEHLVETNHSEENIILDRSFISTLAYQYSSDHDWPSDMILGCGEGILDQADEVYLIQMKAKPTDMFSRIKARDGDKDEVANLAGDRLKYRLQALEIRFKKAYNLIEERFWHQGYRRSINSSRNTVRESVEKVLKCIS